MKEYQNEWSKKYQKKHPESHRKCSQKWKKEHPEIIKAESLALYHIPLGSICEFGNCHSTENLERAHMDYDYPLEVLTFCARHHHLVDRLYREFD